MKELQTLNEMAELIMEEFISPLLCWDDPCSSNSSFDIGNIGKRTNNKKYEKGEQHNDDERNPRQEESMTRFEKREKTREMIKESLAEHKMLRSELESIKNDSSKLVAENENWKKLFEKRQEGSREEEDCNNDQLEEDNRLLLEKGKKLQEELDAMQRQLETIRQEQDNAKRNTTRNNISGSNIKLGVMSRHSSPANVIRV